MQACGNVSVAGIEPVDRSALEDLGRALWSGHAAALIGTGFSRDALPHSEHTPPIALWGDLIKDMQDALGEHNETNVLTCHPLSGRAQDYLRGGCAAGLAGLYIGGHGTKAG